MEDKDYKKLYEEQIAHNKQFKQQFQELLTQYKQCRTLYEELLGQHKKYKKRCSRIIVQSDRQYRELSKLNEKLEESAHNNSTDGTYKQLYEELLVQHEKHKQRCSRIIIQSDRHAKELNKLNEKLEEASNTDPMTGAYNRRFFYRTSEHMISIARREKYPVSVAILDIDHFKNINDTYGHDIGDVIIKDLVHQLEQNMRKSDLFARFGGEEFVVLLNHTDINHNAMGFFERLRTVIENSTPVDDVKYTVSIGVSPVLDSDEKIDTALKRADLALYEAKESGRNRVVEYKSDDNQ